MDQIEIYQVSNYKTLIYRVQASDMSLIFNEYIE